ncbi:O-fucosyltransferase 7-like [Zingiber officinale]|uniref:O-fucosyltransferase 7-like n=1 Tax=Zingiber officinale TaxID=94328 RepID=UPI001C4AC1F6|nr:O-fucosyltransferase 7-like [Zingiber officinale]
MQRRRLRPTMAAVLPMLLVFAVATVFLVSLLDANVDVSASPSSLSTASFYKLSQRDGIGRIRRPSELKWIQEEASPQLSKWNASAGEKREDYAKLWIAPSSRGFVPCLKPNSAFSPPGASRGYLSVSTNGGLNQMRAGIADMIAVARIINATLVIPKLDKGSFWHDLSNFSDVFDEEYFIQSLENDVRIVKKLPKELATVTKTVKYFRSWSPLEYYQDEISKLWDDYKVIKSAKSDSRLANNNMPSEIQKLRCRAFYESLRFARGIQALGKSLVERMRSYGPFIALHLRYEKDMLAFSGCTYGLNISEAEELTTIRETTPYWKVKDIDPVQQRLKGYCPLTPKEVGTFLSCLGYPSNTPIYIASGEIYGGDSHMADLQSRFPILLSKEKLASAAELEPFRPYAAQMAALDYIVSVESDVFIPSYSGNMARAVNGHRRYLGHRRTITPDRKTLVRLFDKVDQGLLQGEKLSSIILEIHKKRQGSPSKRKGPVSGTRGMERFRSEESFYENPLPDCLCQRSESRSNNQLINKSILSKLSNSR